MAQFCFVCIHGKLPICPFTNHTFFRHQYKCTSNIIDLPSIREKVGKILYNSVVVCLYWPCAKTHCSATITFWKAFRKSINHLMSSFGFRIEKCLIFRYGSDLTPFGCFKYKRSLAKCSKYHNHSWIYKCRCNITAPKKTNTNEWWKYCGQKF